MTEKTDVRWVTNLCITPYATVLNWTTGSASPSISKSRNRNDRYQRSRRSVYDM